MKKDVSRAKKTEYRAQWNVFKDFCSYQNTLLTIHETSNNLHFIRKCCTVHVRMMMMLFSLLTFFRWMNCAHFLVPNFDKSSLKTVAHFCRLPVWVVFWLVPAFVSSGDGILPEKIHKTYCSGGWPGSITWTSFHIICQPVSPTFLQLRNSDR